MADVTDLAGRYAVPEGRTYLNTAAEGLPLQSGLEALQAYWKQKSRGALGRASFEEAEEACRGWAAQLLQVEACDVGIVPSTSDGLNAFAYAHPWGSADQVIVTDLEFPSNVLPWLALRDRFGIQLDVVPTRGGTISATDVLERLTPRTRVVSVSAVSYKSGGLTDLAALTAGLRQTEALLCIDATQALGAIPLKASAWDVLWCSGYKWLGALHGAAVMVCSQRARQRLGHGPVGWRSVPSIFVDDRFSRVRPRDDGRRFSLGAPSYAAVFALERALATFAGADRAAVAAHLRRLGDVLLDGLRDLAVAPLTPADWGQRAGIVSFEHPNFARVGETLAERGVDVWSKDGRLRISFHVYNTVEDMARCLTALADLVARPRVAAARKRR